MKESEEVSQYELTRLGSICARLSQYPLDIDRRDEILRCICYLANKNPRPMIFEEDFMDLANLINEKLNCVEVVQSTSPQKGMRI